MIKSYLAKRCEQRMRVAVLMSTYNGEKYIREQIDSILSQSGEFDLDLWVRDDGSIDSTQNILREYTQQGKLQWYTGENLRSAHSFLDLVKKCKGYDYYAFSDQDDYWMPNKVQTGVNSLTNLDNSIPALYFANAELVGSNLEPWGRNVYVSVPRTDFETLCCAGGYLGCTMIFNSALAKKIQDKPMPGKILMHDFYVALLCSVFDGNILYDSKAYMKYRQHENNVIGVVKGSVMGRIKEICRKDEISIAEQAQTLLLLYEDDINERQANWIERISCYKKSMISQLMLSFSTRTHYMNLNMGIKLRLSILFGNR